MPALTGSWRQTEETTVEASFAWAFLMPPELESGVDTDPWRIDLIDEDAIDIHHPTHGVIRAIRL